MGKTKRWSVLTIILGVLLSSLGYYAYQILYTPNVLVRETDEDMYFYIPEGSDYQWVQKELYDRGIVNNMVSFSFLAKVMKYQENVKEGRYLLKKEMTNREAIKILRGGMQAPVDITFNNVRLLEELPGKITQNIALDSSDYARYLLDQAVAEKYGFEEETFISMFLPNTYEVYWTVSAEDLTEKMHREYERFWNADGRKEKAEALGLTQVQVSTLASIVQAESQKYDEQPVIAGVYLNRLKRGIALQADPTLVFAVGDFSIKRVLNVHKEIDSPYNTYKYPGLPPGPINMPDIRAIDAVLNYKQHKYIYFCAKEDFSGYHNFAATLSEHERNRRKYQQALNEAGIYK